jgi:choloylglycine hydrolase
MKKLLVFFLSSVLLSFPFWADACTDFRLIAKDGTILVTRSMEFATDLKSHLRTSNRDRIFNTTINGKPGLNWKAIYGYVYLDGEGQDFAVDGMNEAGLSFEALYLPGETQYQSIPQGKENFSLPYINIGDWILSNFKTIDEVKNALSKIYVVSQLLPGMGDVVFPLHFSVFDETGKGIVIEYVNGNLSLNDNIGVMTNSPIYAWHVTDLTNYINLSPYNPRPVVVNGVSYTATGQGAGAMGLPGDTSPTSRFVRIAFLTVNAYQANNAADLLNLAEHTINDVDIATGVSRSLTNGKESSDYTQWVVFKDLTNKQFYYRTYSNMTLHLVDMKKLDFSPTATRLNMDIASLPYAIDMTDKFKAAVVSLPKTVTAKK